MQKFITITLVKLMLVGCAAHPSTPAPGATEAFLTATPLRAPTDENLSGLYGWNIQLIGQIVRSTTYTDPNLNYAFDYPQDWVLTSLPEQPGSTLTVTSWDPARLPSDRPQSEGIPEGGEKLDITPLTNFGVDFDSALPWFREQHPGEAFTEEMVQLPGGTLGVLFVFEPEPDAATTRCLITEIEQTAIMACGMGWPQAFFEPIAFSLRAADWN